MPIRPENRDRYPADWPQISLRIRTVRAGGRCECAGECGRGTHSGRCPNRQGEPAYGTGSTVQLTVAHLNHQPEDCREENLAAMCNGCHLHYDRDHHRQTRAATWRAALEAAGQLALTPAPTRNDTMTIPSTPAGAIRFDAPAPPIPREQTDIHAFALRLRARPGQWALYGQVQTAMAARGRAHRMRNPPPGRRYAPFEPAGSFEAEARTLLGEFRIYVRYVGPNTGGQ